MKSNQISHIRTISDIDFSQTLSKTVLFLCRIMYLPSPHSRYWFYSSLQARKRLSQYFLSFPRFSLSISLPLLLTLMLLRVFLGPYGIVDEQFKNIKIVKHYSPLHSSLSQCFFSVCIPSGSTPGQFFLSVDAQNLSRITVHPLSQGPQFVQLLHPPLGAIWKTSNHTGYSSISGLFDKFPIAAKQLKNDTKILGIRSIKNN